MITQVVQPRTVTAGVMEASVLSQHLLSCEEEEFDKIIEGMDIEVGGLLWLLIHSNYQVSIVM